MISTGFRLPLTKRTILLMIGEPRAPPLILNQQMQQPLIFSFKLPKNGVSRSLHASFIEVYRCILLAALLVSHDRH